jgi:hypothetical protein
MNRNLFASLLVLGIVSYAPFVLAQDPSAADAINQIEAILQEDAQAQPAVPVQPATPMAQQAPVTPNAPVTNTEELQEMSSILFTFWEHTAIKDAKNARGMTRPPSEDELTRDLNKGPQSEKVKPPAEQRDISLGGIVFVNGQDWTIWLNNQRITPDAIPPQIIDIKVYKEYVEMKWLDEYTNQIFPIRLRAHQRFNIDTRIFLPG